MTSFMCEKLQSKVLKIPFYFLIIFSLVSCKNVKNEFWSNGNKKSEIEYFRNKIDGKAKWWFQNGKIQMEAEFKNGQLNGRMTRWFINGQRETQVFYLNGNKNGTEYVWNEKGFKISEIQYTNDTLDGKYYLWYTDGNVKLIAEYKKGLFNGNWESYNENGVLISKANFNSGNGTQKILDVWGNVESEIIFKNNLITDTVSYSK